MKNKMLINIFFGNLFMVVFLWLRTFIHLTSYEEGKIIYGNVRVVMYSIGLTLFCYWWLVNGIFDRVETFCDINIKKYTIVVGTVSLALLAALLLEICCPGFAIYGSTSIVIWKISVSKKYLFDVVAVLILPLLTEYCFKAMKKENFSLKARLTGVIQIMSFTVGAVLLFYALRNIYLIHLAIISCCTIGPGIKKYIWNHKGVRRGNVFVAGVLYLAVWMMVLFLRVSGKGIAEFMYGGDWNGYVGNVRNLVANASAFGTSKELIEMRSIHEWLYNRGNYIHQLFFYGGWAAVILFIGFMIGFLVILIKMFGFRYFRIHKHQLVFTAAFVVLTTRVVLGLFYSFGLFPYPVALPFAGSNGIVTDSIVFALLIKCAWENDRIDKVKAVHVVSAQTFLGEADKYMIVEADGGAPYLEESIEEDVIIKGSNKQMKCSAVRYSNDDREYAVLIPKERKTDVLIMESLGNEAIGKWKPVEDNEKQSALLGKYIWDALEDIVEVEENAKG